jgi:Cu/Ag efflux protein CusF
MLPLPRAQERQQLHRRSEASLADQKKTVVTHKLALIEFSIIFRRHQLVLLRRYSAPELAGHGHAQPLATNPAARVIVNIDAECGEVKLRHEPIAHLHPSARTTIFQYVDRRVILRAKAGDKVRFRTDRFE